MTLIYKHTYIYIHTYIYTYTDIHTYTNIHTYMYIHTHSSQVCMKIFSRTDNIIGHKISPNKFKRTETVSSIFSNHNGMKLEWKTEKEQKLMETEQHVTKKKCWNQTRNQKMPWNKQKWKQNNTKFRGQSKRNLRRKFTAI